MSSGFDAAAFAAAGAYDGPGTECDQQHGGQHVGGGLEPGAAEFVIGSGRVTITGVFDLGDGDDLGVRAPGDRPGDRSSPSGWLPSSTGSVGHDALDTAPVPPDTPGAAMTSDRIIAGAGGFGRELRELLETQTDLCLRGFLDDDPGVAERAELGSP